MLPSEFPKWRTVHAYFSNWSEPGPDSESALERAFKKCSWRGPYKTGAHMLDELFDHRAQSVNNTDSTHAKGYDAGKKVSGIKRHIAVDTQGLPHAIAVTTADVTDRKNALLALGRCAAELRQVQCILADSGYQGQSFATALEQLLGAKVQIARRNELHTFAVMPQRWVVERSFAWLEKCRRLWKNCERKLNTSLQFIHLAFLALLFKRS